MAGLINPKNAEAQKGFLEGRHLKVTDAGWVIFDGEGNWTYEATCYWMQLEDVDGNLEDPVDNYWSIGKPADFIPQNGGASLKNKKEKMSKNCNLYHFAVSMINAGVPEEIVDALEDNAKATVGMEFRMGRTFRSKKDTKGVDTMDELFVAPGEAATPEDAAKAVIDKVMSSNGDSVSLRKLPKLVTSVIEDMDFEPDFAKDVRKLAISKKFLKENFTLDGNNLVL